MNNNIQITQINPRVTLITEKIPYAKSLAMGFITAAGSRYETNSNNGLTHLTEHMLFKGSEQLTAFDIAKFFESLGVQLDAYTAKESVGVTCHFLPENFDSVVNLLFRLMREVNFNEEELAKEKQVVLQEIREINDNPQEYIHELFAQIMFPGHPLSYPIAGRPHIVSKLSSNDLINFHKYTTFSTRLCVSLAGQLEHTELLDKIMKLNFHYKNTNYWVMPTPPIKNNTKTLIYQIRSQMQQVHTIIGFYTIPYTDELRYQINLLNCIMGGALSSHLNQRLREKEGLTNYIISYLDLYCDIGLWAIYFITESRDLNKVSSIIMEELKNIKKVGITNQELQWAKNYYKGIITLASELPTTRALTNAQQYLYLKRVVSINDIFRLIDQVQINDLNERLSLLDNQNYCCATVGSILKEDLNEFKNGYEKIIEVATKQ